jgi:hypothetical protein
MDNCFKGGMIHGMTVRKGVAPEKLTRCAILFETTEDETNETTTFSVHRFVHFRCLSHGIDRPRPG